eukprot:PhM_4_TR18443/c0_g1_i1/m.72923
MSSLIGGAASSSTEQHSTNNNNRYSDDDDDFELTFETEEDGGEGDNETPKKPPPTPPKKRKLPPPILNPSSINNKNNNNNVNQSLSSSSDFSSPESSMSPQVTAAVVESPPEPNLAHRRSDTQPPRAMRESVVSSRRKSEGGFSTASTGALVFSSGDDDDMEREVTTPQQQQSNNGMTPRYDVDLSMSFVAGIVDGLDETTASFTGVQSLLDRAHLAAAVTNLPPEQRLHLCTTPTSAVPVLRDLCERLDFGDTTLAVCANALVTSLRLFLFRDQWDVVSMLLPCFQRNGGTDEDIEAMEREGVVEVCLDVLRKYNPEVRDTLYASDARDSVIQAIAILRILSEHSVLCHQIVTAVPKVVETFYAAHSATGVIWTEFSNLRPTIQEIFRIAVIHTPSLSERMNDDNNDVYSCMFRFSLDSLYEQKPGVVPEHIIPAAAPLSKVHIMRTFDTISHLPSSSWTGSDFRSDVFSFVLEEFFPSVFMVSSEAAVMGTRVLARACQGSDVNTRTALSHIERLAAFAVSLLDRGAVECMIEFLGSVMMSTSGGIESTTCLQHLCTLTAEASTSSSSRLVLLRILSSRLPLFSADYLSTLWAFVGGAAAKVSMFIPAMSSSSSSSNDALTFLIALATSTLRCGREDIHFDYNSIVQELLSALTSSFTSSSNMQLLSSIPHLEAYTRLQTLVPYAKNVEEYVNMSLPLVLRFSSSTSPLPLVEHHRLSSICTVWPLLTEAERASIFASHTSRKLSLLKAILGTDEMMDGGGLLRDVDEELERLTESSSFGQLACSTSPTPTTTTMIMDLLFDESARRSDIQLAALEIRSALLEQFWKLRNNTNNNNNNNNNNTLSHYPSSASLAGNSDHLTATQSRGFGGASPRSLSLSPSAVAGGRQNRHKPVTTASFAAAAMRRASLFSVTSSKSNNIASRTYKAVTFPTLLLQSSSSVLDSDEGLDASTLFMPLVFSYDGFTQHLSSDNCVEFMLQQRLFIMASVFHDAIAETFNQLLTAASETHGRWQRLVEREKALQQQQSEVRAFKATLRERTRAVEAKHHYAVDLIGEKEDAKLRRDERSTAQSPSDSRNVQSEIEALREENVALRAQLLVDTESAHVAHLTSQVNDLTLKNEKLVREVNSMRCEHEDWKSNNKDVLVRIRTQEGLVNEYKQTIAGQEKTLENSVKRAHRLAVAVGQLEQEKKTLEQAHDISKAQMQRCELLLQDMAQLADFRRAITRLSESSIAHALEERLEILARENESLQRELSGRTSQLTEANGKLFELQKQYDILQGRLSDEQDAQQWYRTRAERQERETMRIQKRHSYEMHKVQQLLHVEQTTGQAEKESREKVLKSLETERALLSEERKRITGLLRVAEKRAQDAEFTAMEESDRARMTQEHVRNLMDKVNELSRECETLRNGIVACRQAQKQHQSIARGMRSRSNSRYTDDGNAAAAAAARAAQPAHPEPSKGTTPESSFGEGQAILVHHTTRVLDRTLPDAIQKAARKRLEAARATMEVPVCTCLCHRDPRATYGPKGAARAMVTSDGAMKRKHLCRCACAQRGGAVVLGNGEQTTEQQQQHNDAFRFGDPDPVVVADVGNKTYRGGGGGTTTTTTTSASLYSSTSLTASTIKARPHSAGSVRQTKR